MNGRIFTIGHGNHSREDLLKQLTQTEVSFVVDVRSTPYSRYQPEFSRDALEHFLREHRLRYVFMGDLLGGRPQNDDCYTDGMVDYTKVRGKEFFVRGIARIKNAYEQGLSICLLCSEGQPSQCHRAKLVGAALSDEGINVTHLLPDGSRRSQAEVIAQITKGQCSLFAEHFVSRKAYR
ncbi:MAG: DUF488 domain-containing protein [Desulfobacteria bacterium]